MGMHVFIPLYLKSLVLSILPVKYITNRRLRDCFYFYIRCVTNLRDNLGDSVKKHPGHYPFPCLIRTCFF